jgi:O-antigen/teichoic acid export membrane protein
VLESAKVANILAYRMRSTLLWRRGATAAGIYGAAAFGFLGTVVASRQLSVAEYGSLAIVVAATGFFQTMFDLTFEEALVKFGFRYAAQERYGRLRRLFAVALRVKLAGGLAAALMLLCLAPFAGWLWGGELALPFVIGAGIPLAQAPEGVAGAALMLRSRYDIRGLFLLVSMVLRFTGLAIGSHYGVWQAVLGMLVAQVIATAAVWTAGRRALARFPGDDHEALAEERVDIKAFAVQSSIATGVVSVRALVAPLLLGLVSPTTQVANFRNAQAPQTGFASLSAPARMVLLAEQTREWERGRREVVFRSVRRYTLAALGLSVLVVPPLWFAMEWLLVHVYGDKYRAAAPAARLILLAAAMQLVVGWTKSFPVTIGRPGLRTFAHGIESATLVPLVLVFGAAWGATGAAGAVLAASAVFVAVWTVLYARIKRTSSVEVDVPRNEAGQVLGL